MSGLLPFSKATLLRALSAAVLFSLLALLLAGCAVDTPQNTFAPEGEIADKQRDIFNYALWPAIVIFIIVEGLLVFALIRFRQRRGDALPKQVHGNTRLEIAWTVLPAILILALGGVMLPIIIDLARDPDADALQVKVVGHQWFWEFQYPKQAGIEEELVILGTPGQFAELHIPVQREVDASVTSDDVIHSFWVPRLAGKIDAVPGRTNKLLFNATKPGTYSGQCAEFCGLAHAEMRLIVVVHESEEDFQDWVDEQLQAAKAGSGEPALTRQGE